MALPAAMEGQGDLFAFRKGLQESLFVSIQDPENPGTPADPQSIKLDIIDDSDNVVKSVDADSLNKISTGVYQYVFDTTVLSDRNYLAAWTFTWPTRTSTANQAIMVRPSRIFRWLPYLRGQVDKAAKSVNLGLAYGYDDNRLVAYIDLGTTLINVVPPVTNFLPENFPENYLELLIEASTITVMDAQNVFSIDADVDYQLGGNAIRISHAAPISTYLGQMVQRFNDNIKPFKQQYRLSGKILVGTPFSYAVNRFLRAAPPGWWDRFGIHIGRMTV